MTNVDACCASRVVFRDLTIRYGDRIITRIPALTIAPNSYVLVMGPNGCGKSSIALALAGVITEVTEASVSGSIQFVDERGRCVETPTAGRVAAVWQNPRAQLFRGTVLDEVLAGLDYQCIPAADAKRRAREALRLVGLDRIDEGRDPLTLSDGEQQRLALAAVLVLDTAVLVLDEVTSQLDERSWRDLQRVLARVRTERELTVIAFDHRPASHMSAADRVIVLDHTGTIVIDDAPDVVFGKHAARCRSLGLRVPQAMLPAEYRSGAATEPAPIEQHLFMQPTAAGEETTLAGGQTLTVESVTVRARGRTSRPLVENVTFHLPMGAVALLEGTNGAGKSTLLRVLAGVERKHTGVICPDARSRQRAGIGFAPQRGSELLFASTVRAELRQMLPVQQRVAHVVDALLDCVGLLSVADMHPQRLSGGQRQRLAVLLATLNRPALLLLDEPTNAQDGVGVRQLVELIAESSAERITLIATHEASVFAGVATHQIVLADGAVISIAER